MWQEPKTDWVAEDYFNYSDYNRIKNNIAYLRSLAESNTLEDNLESLRKNTFLFDDSDPKQWYENQRTPNYEDFNRLEKACLLFYNGFKTQKAHKPFLPQILGGFWRGAERHIGTLVFKDNLAMRLGADKFVKI